MTELIRMLIFIFCLNVFTPIQSRENIPNEIISKDLNLLQNHKSQKKMHDRPIEKTTSKSRRQRMSAGKIFGIVIAVILGAALGGLFLGGVIVPAISVLLFR